MKICCLADTHGQHLEVDIPKCDMVLFAGDCLNYGDDDLEFYKFANWINMFDCPVVMIGGNHDGILEMWGKKKVQEFLKPNIVYLEHESYTLPNGMTLFGSPWTPKFMDWWFLYDPKDAKKLWSAVPDKVDILLTHGPAYGHLDEDKRAGLLGCKALTKRIEQVKPQYHIFGHIHRDDVKDFRFSTRREMAANTTFINCGVLDNWYNPVWDPIIIEV